MAKNSNGLVHIPSLPMGTESTGLQIVDNMHGHANFMNNYQHAVDLNGTNPTVHTRILPLINTNKLEVAYFGGLRAHNDLRYSAA